MSFDRILQVLWLGHPECHATWEPAKSLPQSLVDSFEDGVMAESKVDSVNLYGHWSSIIATKSSGDKDVDEPKGKRTRQERPCYDDLEGYEQF